MQNVQILTSLCISEEAALSITWSQIPKTVLLKSGKPGTIRESNQASGVRKAHYYHGTLKLHFVRHKLVFSPINIHFSDYPKSLISMLK